MRALLALLLIFAAAAHAAPVERISPAIAELQSGVICPPPTVAKQDAPDTVAGSMNLIDENPPFISNNHAVPAVVGIGFGVKARAEDLAGIPDVTMTVTHPPMGPDGTTQQSFPTRIRGGDLSLIFYQFDYRYELLPGEWTMTASAGGEVLYVARFIVVPPQLAPELARICGYEDLLS